eukprot:2106238-Amphidinium_carterae.1
MQGMFRAGRELLNLFDCLTAVVNLSSAMKVMSSSVPRSAGHECSRLLAVRNGSRCLVLSIKGQRNSMSSVTSN